MECIHGGNNDPFDDYQEPEALYFLKYEANTINPMHYPNKCYVLRFFSHDPLDYRIVAVFTSRTKAEQLKEQYIKFRGADDKRRCDRYREELEIVEHELSFWKSNRWR